MVVVIEDIKEKEKREWWRDIIKDERVGVTFSMNKLGILFFDLKMIKQNYIL
jgi:hypothetical protein